MAIHNKIDYPLDEIRRRIEAGETQQKIADDLSIRMNRHVDRRALQKVLKKIGVKCQRTGPRSGEGHPEWKGGRIIDRAGYVGIYCPDHPFVRKHTPYVLEHRLVMEGHLGRHLLPSEVVHHKNGNKQDNRIENLECFESNAKHLAETLVGQCPKWTREGLCRMRAAAALKWCPEAKKYDLSVVARALLSIQTELGLDAPPSKIEIVHWTNVSGKGLLELCEMEFQRGQRQSI